MLVCMDKPRRRLAGFLAFALALPLAPIAASSTANAAPGVPDDLPVFPAVQEDPRVEVTTEDGAPIEGRTVHRGDVLLVHGEGFSPDANRGGFPLPIPPGTPNGVFVLYSGFPEAWKPSEGAPSDARTHPHDRMAWVMPAGTLESIPTAPVDMRRSIARVAQPMAADGSFTARIVVDPPAKVPGDHWGVYLYPGAGSVNAAEEIFVPIPFSPDPGPDTPAPARPDLVVDANVVYAATAAAGGGVNPRFGASAQPGDRVGFTRDTASEAEANDGIARYAGTVTATARFNTVEVAMRNPWIEPRPDGRSVLTAEVSTRPDVGADEMRRTEIGTLGPVDDSGAQALTAGPLEIGRATVAG